MGYMNFSIACKFRNQSGLAVFLIAEIKYLTKTIFVHEDLWGHGSTA